MKKLVLSALFVLQAVFVFAQEKPALTGKVIDSKSQKPLQNVVATIQSTNQTVLTDFEGNFVFQTLPVGEQALVVRFNGYLSQTLLLEVTKGETLELGNIVLQEDITSEQQLSLVTITENDLGDDNSGSESTSGLLQATRDTYQQAAAFSWGQARFRIRGLDNEYGSTMINGVKMNKIYDGRPQWGNWGGLNDATRNQEFSMGSTPSDYTFGGALGTQEINTRASHYRPGTRLTFSGTNTNYSFRAMGTHVSGLDKDGWAFVISASRRWTEEGAFEGTTYNANSLFASVEKKFNDKHSLNFTSIYAKNRRGKNSPNTAEVTDLAGIRYNSYWGYQNGEKRNSRVKDLDEPINMLTHYWKINENNKLTSNVMYQTGSVGNSRIDYQGVNNPDPTYYRNLPSYYKSLYESRRDVVTLTNPEAYLPGGLGGINLYSNYNANMSVNNPSDIPYINAYNGANTAKFLTDRQINWNSLYAANAQSGSSKYVLYEDRTDDKQWTANTILNSQISDHLTLNAGLNYTSLKSHNFKNLLDLLGGSFYNDITLFGSGEQQQVDLNNPNRTVVKGDTFGYNYNLNANVIDGFTQFKFNYNKFDFYLSQSFSRTEYQREGLYKNGYYPNNSYGYGEKVKYDNFGLKGGLTYKLSGRSFLTFNGLIASKAPTLRNVFSNARVTNNVTRGVKEENISSADIGYIFRGPKLNARITAFFSEIRNQTETSFFFGDGAGIDDPSSSLDESNAFVAETVTNINKQNLGVEIGLEYKITSTIKATSSLAYGQYIYSNNPNVAISIDRFASTVNYGESHIKNYKQSGTPQAAANLGLEYRAPKFWWVGANVNYLANSYIDIAPITRTDRFFIDPASNNGSAFPEATQSRADELLKQEKFDNFYLLNLIGGKSWRISNKNRNTVGFFASVNNVLDIEYKTGGFEQARNSNYRQLNQDVSSGSPSFGPKYFYGFGRNYFVNVYINF